MLTSHMPIRFIRRRKIPLTGLPSLFAGTEHIVAWERGTFRKYRDINVKRWRWGTTQMLGSFTSAGGPYGHWAHNLVRGWHRSQWQSLPLVTSEMTTLSKHCSGGSRPCVGRGKVIFDKLRKICFEHKAFKGQFALIPPSVFCLNFL